MSEDPPAGQSAEATVLKRKVTKSSLSVLEVWKYLIKAIVGQASKRHHGRVARYNGGGRGGQNAGVSSFSQATKQPEMPTAIMGNTQASA